MDLLHQSVIWFGENITWIAAAVAILTSSFYALHVSLKCSEPIRENIKASIGFGLAGAHLPTAIVLIASGLNTDYLSFLESQGVIVSLSGFALALYIVSILRDGLICPEEQNQSH